MNAGAALGQVAPVVMGLAGLVTILRARRTRRVADPEAERRIASGVEMERRMAAYLASREDRK